MEDLQTDGLVSYDIQRRRMEIESSGLLRNCKEGEFMGMNVFEGAVVLKDKRKESEELRAVNVRIILGRDIRLPTLISQHKDYSETNNSLFAMLYFDAMSAMTDGLVYILPPEKVRGKLYESGNAAMGELLDQYGKINPNGGGYPLTIIYAHGDVDKSGNHTIHAGAGQDHKTEELLKKLIAEYPPPNRERIPLMLTSCNENDGISSEISHPNMIIAFKRGEVRGTRAPVPTVVSK